MPTSSRNAFCFALAILTLSFFPIGGLSDPGETSRVETSRVETSRVGTGLNLSYIWSIDGLEPEGQVVMALSQNGSELYGPARYEPDSGPGWNGQVVGFIDVNEIQLVISSGQDKSSVSRRLTGIYDSENQSIVGEFIKVDEGRITKRGRFNAIWINPDVSGYVQAAVRDGEQEAGEEGRANEKKEADLPVAASETSQGDSMNASRYYDVHQEAESVMTGICGMGRGL